MNALLYTPALQTEQIMCKPYYVSNGKYCPMQKHREICPKFHFLSSYKICTPTYTERYCYNEEKCKFSHFLPYNYYCCNYFLFKRCQFVGTCPFIHMSENCIVYNLLIPFKTKFINLFIGQIKHYYQEMYMKAHTIFLEQLMYSFKVGYRIANFRTDARCILCGNKVSDAITPQKRLRLLLYNNSKSTISCIPNDLIKVCIAPYLFHNTKYEKCLFLRQKTTNKNILQLYEKRYVRRDDTTGRDGAICVPRAIPDMLLPNITLNNLAVTTRNLSLYLPGEVITEILCRAIEYLPV